MPRQISKDEYKELRKGSTKNKVDDGTSKARARYDRLYGMLKARGALVSRTASRELLPAYWPSRQEIRLL